MPSHPEHLDDPTPVQMLPPGEILDAYIRDHIMAQAPGWEQVYRGGENYWITEEQIEEALVQAKERGIPREDVAILRHPDVRGDPNTGAPQFMMFQPTAPGAPGLNIRPADHPKGQPFYIKLPEDLGGGGAFTNWAGGKYTGSGQATGGDYEGTGWTGTGATGGAGAAAGTGTTAGGGDWWEKGWQDWWKGVGGEAGAGGNLEEASNELASLITDLVKMGRDPQVMGLLQKMTTMESEMFDQFRGMMEQNIQRQGQARDMGFDVAQQLASGDYMSKDVMSRLVDPLQAKNLEDSIREAVSPFAQGQAVLPQDIMASMEALRRGEFVSPQVKEAINQVAQEQRALGESDLTANFETALRQARGEALGRNVFDVEAGQLSTPGMRGFDLALQERTRQSGQLARGTSIEAIQQQLRTGMDIQQLMMGGTAQAAQASQAQRGLLAQGEASAGQQYLARNQLLAGGLSEAFKQGIGGLEAQQRAIAPYFDLASRGYPPTMPTYMPNALQMFMPGGQQNQQLMNIGAMPNQWASLLGSFGSDLAGAAIPTLLNKIF